MRHYSKYILSVTLALLTILFLAAISHSSEKTYGGVFATIHDVHDGDTLTVDIKSWPPIVGDHIGIRVYGVDTRELKSGGQPAKRFVQGLIKVGDTVYLSNIMRDKYFRLVSLVGFDCDKKTPPECTDLSETLLKYHFAQHYLGGTKLPFPSTIK